MATGQPVDISLITRLTFWERVLYCDGGEPFPSDSREETGRFVGIAPHVGHAMTYLILTDDTQKVVPRLRVQPFSAKDPNRRVGPLGGETQPVLKTFPKPSPDKSSTDTNCPSTTYSDPAPTASDSGAHIPAIPTFSPDDLIGRSFVLPPDEEGHHRRRLRIAEKLVDDNTKLERHPT